MLNAQELPNIMYFGASKQFLELKGRVFLAPHLGIASFFIINTPDLLPQGYKTSCNIGYKQWSYSNDLLLEPLQKVNVTHNIVDFKNKTFTGTSSGYIHVIDISEVKDKLSLFVTNNPDREVIYNGEQPLTIIKCIPHTVQWDFSFSQTDVEKHGIGIAEKLY